MARLRGWPAALAAAFLALAAAAFQFPATARAGALGDGHPGSPAGPANAPVVPVVNLPPRQLPESIAMDRFGDIYLGLFGRGRVLRISPSGHRSVFAAFPPGSIALGVRLDRFGFVYVAVAGPDSGVWRVPPGGGTPVMLASVPGLPDGLAFDAAGDLYVSDAIGGAVYRISRSGIAQLWSDSPLLAGTTGDGPCGLPHPSGLPLGASGIAFDRHGDLLVANTTQGTIVHIRMRPDGSAGMARVLAGPDCRLWGADGMTTSASGTLYLAANAAEDIVRASPGGRLTVIASRAAGDPLSTPSGIAFGPAWHDRALLYISNFAMFHRGRGAGVVRTSVPDLPLP